MANTKNELSVGTKLYHFGYGRLTIEKVEELNGKTYLHTKVDDISGVPYRLKKDINTLVIFDKRTIDQWVFLKEENVLNINFDFELEGACGNLNTPTADLVNKLYLQFFIDGLTVDTSML